jgi:hypothetical protein
MKKLLSLLLTLISVQVFAFSPTLLSPASDSVEAPTKIFFYWQHNAGVSYYDIDVDTTPLFNSSFHSVVNGTFDYSAYTPGNIVMDSIAELHFGTKYYWKVTPRNVIGGTASEIRNFTTVYKPKIFGLNPIPALPLTVANIKPTFYTNFGTHTYYLEIGNTTIFTSPIYYSTTGDLSQTPHQSKPYFNNVTGLSAGITYYLRMKEYNLQDSSDWSDTIAFTTVEDGSAVIELNNGTESLFFPNPANDEIQFNIISTDSPVNIYNAHGEIVLSSLISSTNSRVNVSELNTGIYLIQITEKENMISTYKLIIAR